MNRERLKHLITVLQRAERRIKTNPRKNRFDLHRWGHEAKKAGCHTVACAAGWAVLDPKFCEQGLKPAADWTLEPSYRHKFGTQAMATFLDISEIRACDLFLPEYYTISRIRPKHVIAKIRAMLGAP